MLNLDSIANKFRLSYFVFALLLCSTFVSIFFVAETKIEQALVESRMLQQLQLTLEHEDQKKAYHTNSGISIYHFEAAPENLQKMATDSVQELEIVADDKATELHFLKYNYQNQEYILSYLESSLLSATDYPVLTIFEELEAIIYTALSGAIILSLLIAILFSYLSSKAITKPILDLKKSVESENQQLDKLTHLPSEIGVLARAIDEKNHKLEQYLKREQLFTGDVSHELRTPLTIIMGASEVLASQLDHNSSLSEFTDRISTTAKETSEIISALLLLSRAPEKLDAPQTSINNTAINETERLKYLLKYKPVTCTIVAEKEHIANIRPELLKMALGNLIKNAFQYTDDGEVRVTIDDEKITVTDTGLGIPEAMMPLLYERFERLGYSNTDFQTDDDSSTDKAFSNKVEGSGLGLSIVQRIMTHMDWELTHQANKTGGSSFSIYYR